VAGGAALGQAGEEADAVVADPDQEAAVGRLVGDLGDEAGQLAGPGGVLADGRGQSDLVQQGRAQLEHELAEPPDALGRGGRQPCQQLGGAGSRSRPPRAWGWRLTATMAWTASSWMSPATWRRSCSWLVTTRSSSQRRCSSSWRRLRRARWCSVTSRSTTSQPIGGPSRSVMATTVGS
jgi:hypothetical protein